MKIGFIGLGNVGGKLAGSLQRNNFDLVVRDLDKQLAAPFVADGATWAESPKALAQAVDLVITCLPSPAASSEVMEATDGVLAGLGSDKMWLEMSTAPSLEVVIAPPPAVYRFSLVANARSSKRHCPHSKSWVGVSFMLARLALPRFSKW